jgi:hypothetical protein
VPFARQTYAPNEKSKFRLRNGKNSVGARQNWPRLSQKTELK